MSRRGSGAIGALFALTALLALAGCGGGGGDEGAARPPVERQLIVRTANGGFDPVEIYRRASPGVVTIRSLFDQGAGEGSGFVLDDEGHVVTNAHVVTNGEGGGRREAEAVFVEFPDRNVVSAEIIGFDPFADVAVLAVEPDAVELRPLRLGDDGELVVGQSVAVIGSPFGEQQSLSVGIVSATDRSVRSLTEFQIDGAIQTDASINPGNSGGPLLDGDARVIGISQQIETESGANDGVGFAVPISSVKRSVEELLENGEVEYAYIGVSSQALYPQLARRLDLDTEFGSLVSDVAAGGPADEAGLRGGNEKLRFQGVPYEIGGDVILAVDGRDVVRPDDLARHIADREPGETAVLAVLRDGERKDVEVTLGRRPVESPQG